MNKEGIYYNNFASSSCIKKNGMNDCIFAGEGINLYFSYISPAPLRFLGGFLKMSCVGMQIWDWWIS